MSMREYPIHDYGMIVDKHTAEIILSNLPKTDIKTEIDDECSGIAELFYSLYETGICEYISEFTGEAQELYDNGGTMWCGNCEVFDGGCICYIPLRTYPTLFKKSYNNMEEIIDELREDAGEYLPDDFDYRSRLRYICGTYFG